MGTAEPFDGAKTPEFDELEKLYLKAVGEDKKRKPYEPKQTMKELGISAQTLIDCFDIMPAAAVKFLYDPEGETFAFGLMTGEQRERIAELADIFATDQFSQDGNTESWTRFLIRQVVLINQIPFGALAKLTGIEPKALARFTNVHEGDVEDRAIANDAITDNEKFRLLHLLWRLYFALNRYKKRARVIHHLDGMDYAREAMPDFKNRVVTRYKLIDDYDKRFGASFKPFMLNLGFELIADEWGE
ncbi:MAG: hypothetical protein LBC28_04890 [Oscillospiraceae bacterium]|nr:hypothetical protein [Oscillospiraceae bacterium]